MCLSTTYGVPIIPCNARLEFYPGYHEFDKNTFSIIMTCIEDDIVFSRERVWDELPVYILALPASSWDACTGRSRYDPRLAPLRGGHYTGESPTQISTRFQIRQKRHGMVSSVVVHLGIGRSYSLGVYF
jgi:hypothetical protein